LIYKIVYGKADAESFAVLGKYANKIPTAKPEEFESLFKDLYAQLEVHDGQEFFVLERQYHSDGYFFGFGDKEMGEDTHSGIRITSHTIQVQIHFTNRSRFTFTSQRI
jgi:hypothetical protein